MHQAAAASRTAAAGPDTMGASQAAAPTGGTTTPRPGSVGMGSRLLVPTVSSRAKTAAIPPPAEAQGGRSVHTASQDSDAGCSRRRQHTQQMRQQAGRPVAQAQRRRLAAVALVRGNAG